MVAHGDFSMDRFGAACPALEEIGTYGGSRRQPIVNLEAPFIRSRLKDAIEIEIGPRLLLLHHEARVVLPDKRPTREEIEQLARLSIGSDETAATVHFESVRAQGHSFAMLLAYFVAPAAEHLVDLWKDDLCDLFDVALGEIRLLAIMDRFSSMDAPLNTDSRRRAVLVAPPGETQIFGLKVVEKFLEASGWDVTLERPRRAEDAANAVAEERVAVVGVIVSAAARVEIAARTIAQIRRDSMNQGVGVMVGGSIFAESPRLAVQVGADAAWLDAPTAAAVATHLLSRQATAALSREAIPMLSRQVTPSA
jgi:MerR family transcriptional regulator, light-induced transcriptional regulator